MSSSQFEVWGKIELVSFLTQFCLEEYYVVR